jgi:hypothetical protein
VVLDPKNKILGRLPYERVGGQKVQPSASATAKYAHQCIFARLYMLYIFGGRVWVHIAIIPKIIRPASAYVCTLIHMITGLTMICGVGCISEPEFSEFWIVIF